MLLPSPGPRGKWLNWVVLMYGWRAGTRAGSHRDVCWIPAPGLPRGPGMPETGTELCSSWRCCRGWEELLGPPQGWVLPPGWLLPVFLFPFSFTVAISHHRFWVFFSWLFMSGVRRKCGRRMEALGCWWRRSWRFWDLESASCLEGHWINKGTGREAQRIQCPV